MNNVESLNTYNGKWWTREFIDKAYNIVKDRKFPILIPSYINPNEKQNFNPPAISGFLSTMTEEYNYPIIMFVRNSQKSKYEEAITNPYVTIVSMEDSRIDSAGKARKESLQWLYDNGYEHAFSFDDDAQEIKMTERGVTGAGDPKSVVIKDINIAKILACWQLSMEQLEKLYSNVMLTGAYPVGFGWKKEYCECNGSALLYRGNLNQVVCLNVKNIIDNGINYRDNKEYGHEDIDLVMQGLHKDLLVATFPFINYSTPGMDIANFSEFGSTMEERMRTQQNIMRNVWGDDPYITYKDKRGYCQVVPNFRQYRKDKGIENYVIDIWNNGEILNN